MRPILLALLGILFALGTLVAGEQQAFFLATVRQATSVKIVADSGRQANGGVAWKTLLQSNDPKRIAEVVAAIEMEDPKPEKDKATGEDVWTGSVLTFGMPSYIITFLRNGSGLLEYGLEESPNKITPFGAHSDNGTAIMIDYYLSPKSMTMVRALLKNWRTVPNQSTDPTPASGTQAAVQPARQP